jgi:membrane-associated phospholipid phosphatase
VIALLLPVFVAFSRIYRGMHHPLDLGAGALIGVAAPARAPARGGAGYISRRPIPSWFKTRPQER